MGDGILVIFANVKLFLILRFSFSHFLVTMIYKGRGTERWWEQERRGRSDGVGSGGGHSFVNRDRGYSSRS